jgi:hypothetical protein
MIKHIIYKLLKEEDNQMEIDFNDLPNPKKSKELAEKKMLNFVKNLAVKNEDWDWNDIKKYLENDVGVSEEETMLLILKTIIDEDTPWEEHPLDVFNFYQWHKVFGSEMLDIFKEHGIEISIDFSDTYKVGDKVFLRTDGICDFKKLFRYDGDEYMVDKLFCNEDGFELYSYNPTFDESWGSLNKKCIDYIKEYLKQKFLNKVVTPEETYGLEEYLDPTPEGEEESDRVITLTSEKIQRMSDDDLKTLIETSEELDNLKYEIHWSLESAYNTSAYDEISEKISSAIEDVFGKGIWESKKVTRNGKETIKENLIFDVTSIFDDYANNYISERGENPNDEFTYFIDLAKEVLDDSNDLLSTGINYDYYHPDIDGEDMYEELTNRF